MFGVGGGTIGRSADNDWVLPDPQRYVSAHHARVSFRQGHYFLEDVSTNGAFVNDSDIAQSKLGAYRLQSGDRIRLGEYQIVVAVDADTAEPAHPPTDSVQVPTSINTFRPISRAAQTDIGASLDLDALLIPDPGLDSQPRAVPPPCRPPPPPPPRPARSPPTPLCRRPAASLLENSGNQSGGFSPVNAYGQAVARIPRPTENTEPEPDEEVIARRIARLAKAAGKDPKTGASAPALYDVQSGLQAFCRGAGIDAEKLPADAQTRLMHLVGQLFREAFVGMKDHRAFPQRDPQPVPNRDATGPRRSAAVATPTWRWKTCSSRCSISTRRAGSTPCSGCANR